MATQTTSSDEQARVLAIVARLATAADGDTVYRDVYLQRAAALLSPIVSNEHYQGSLTSREQLERLLAQARAAINREDWLQVRDLGARASAVQKALDAEKDLLAVAETIYGAAVTALDPLSPGVTGSKRWAEPARAREEVCAALAKLEADDPTAHALYTARRKVLDALTLRGSVATTEVAAATPGVSRQQQALMALEHGDASALEDLAASMLGAAAARATTPGAAPPTQGRIVAPDLLGEPLPAACLPRAEALGLELVESTASPTLAADISAFMERYALGASPAVHDQARDGIARVAVAAEGVSIPPDLVATFAETISLFALHLYVNSAGVRYVPVPTAREVLFVERHPDGEEPVTPLLRELGLDRRRALSRDEIEQRLLEHGARIVTDHLGLDPLAFRIVCVPPDVFMRIGGSRGWGKREEWTHFDGYQVMRGGRLRALVGGNARFGGLFDLCSISRDDARENTVVRFAVVRRERLGVRIG